MKNEIVTDRIVCSEWLRGEGCRTSPLPTQYRCDGLRVVGGFRPALDGFVPLRRVAALIDNVLDKGGGGFPRLLADHFTDLVGSEHALSAMKSYDPRRWSSLSLQSVTDPDWRAVSIP